MSKPSEGAGLPGAEAAREPEGHGPICDAAETGKSLDLVIEGEQRLLALFDARQATADAKTTAAAAAAILLPAATLTLTNALDNNPTLLRIGYALVAGLAVVTVGLRTWNGTKFRRAEDLEMSGQDAHARRKFSTESREAAQARHDWWRFEADTASDANAVRRLAVQMWRTRAQHSRRIAQSKEKASLSAAVAFAVALLVSVVLVFASNWTPTSAAPKGTQQQKARTTSAEPKATQQHKAQQHKTK